MSMNGLVWLSPRWAGFGTPPPALRRRLSPSRISTGAPPVPATTERVPTIPGPATFAQTDLSGACITNAVGRRRHPWSAGVSLGWGSGPRGVRGEVMLDWRAERDPQGVLAAPSEVTLHTSIQASTIMCDAYDDLSH